MHWKRKHLKIKEGKVSYNNNENPSNNDVSHENDMQFVADVLYEEYVPSYFSHEGGSDHSVPLWLITFTDVVALMLTFFVLMYSMSAPQKSQWDKFARSMGNQFDKEYAKPFHGGTQDTVNIDRIPTVSALNLNYLKMLVTEYIKQEGYKDVAVNHQPRGLVISLPSQILFEQGKSELSSESKVIIYSIGKILSRVKNRIEVIGHTDPQLPKQNEQKKQPSNNWQLSLDRSIAVAEILKESGYKKEIQVRGLSSARYDELPKTIAEQERLTLARRVDIMIMKDTIEQSIYYNAVQ